MCCLIWKLGMGSHIFLVQQVTSQEHSNAPGLDVQQSLGSFELAEFNKVYFPWENSRRNFGRTTKK